MTTANASGGIAAWLAPELAQYTLQRRLGIQFCIYAARAAHEGGCFRHRFLAALASTIRPLPGVLPRGPAGCRDVPRFTGG